MRTVQKPIVVLVLISQFMMVSPSAIASRAASQVPNRDSSPKAMPAVTADLASDRKVAEKIVLGEALYRVVSKNDSNLAFSIINAERATTPAAVARSFEMSRNDKAQPLLDRTTTVALIKLGVGYYGSAGSEVANKLVDGLDDVVKKIEGEKGPMRLDSIPKEYAVAMLTGGFDKMPAEARAKAIDELAKDMGRDVEVITSAVRDKRIAEANGTEINNNGATPFEGVSQQAFSDETALIEKKLDLETKLLQAQIDGHRAAEDLQAQRDDLELTTQHLNAGVAVAGMVLGPVIGARAANQVTGIGNQLIAMDHAMKQFGPGSLTPDKLLMFTNFASAGMAIAGMLMAPKEDPTMMALTAIMAQLEGIKKQLEIIDGKIDDLSALVLLGFERVLRNQSYASDRFENFTRIVNGQIKDGSQREAIQTFLDYTRGQPSSYRMLLACADRNKGSSRDVQDCMDLLTLQLSNRTIMTSRNDQTDPELLSPIWSNQMLTPKSIRDNDDQQLVLEQLSYPIYFADTPASMMSMVARNHEAAASFSRQVSDLQASVVVPNPEILRTRLNALLAAAAIHPQIQSRYGRDLTDQALDRIADIENFLNSTGGNSLTLTRIVSEMSKDLTKFESQVKGVYADLMASHFDEEHKRFFGKGLLNCSQKGGSGMPVVDNLSLIPQKYWVAQALGMGTLGQCVDIRPSKNKMIDDGAGASYFQIEFRIRIYFNPSADGDSNRINSTDASKELAFLTSQSQTISDRTFTTQQHYSTFWGSTAPIVEAAWNSSAIGCHDMLECARGTAGYSNPDRSIPQRDFLKETKEQVDAASLGKLDAWVTTEGLKRLKKVIAAQTPVWNAGTLQFDRAPSTPLLVGRPETTQPFLMETLSSYTKKFLLMKNLLLINSYHENPVGLCLASMDAFSPSRVLDVTSSQIFDGTARAGIEFQQKMSTAIPGCSKHALRGDLQDLKAKLLALRKRQMH